MPAPFSSLTLEASLVEGIQSLGFENMTPVQEEAIPLGLEGNDIIACAQTGTGKTAAYLIPVINQLIAKPGKGNRCLILVPTRELAVQIDQQVMGLGYFTGVESIAVYGGNNSENFSAQQKAFERGTEIIIATPGRLIMLMKLGKAELGNIEHFILDEADKMLDMGFIDDIMFISKALPFRKQTMMFSATMPPKIRTLARSIMVGPDEVNIAISKMAKGITEEYYLAHDEQKYPIILNILEKEDIKSMIIFAGQKSTVDKLTMKIKSGPYKVGLLHSGRDQEERERTLNDFKHGQIQILTATNVVSRGIDVDGISHVLNFDVPGDPEDYVHRAGRTARADNTGKVITLINQEDMNRFKAIANLTGTSPKCIANPEGVGQGPDPRSSRPSKPKGKGRRPFRKNRR